MVEVGAKKKWKSINGKLFDQYDIVSFFYGWIVALQADSTSTTTNQCFLATYSTVQQVDYWIKDWETVLKSGKWFTVLFFDIINIQNNAAAAYE